MPGTLDGIQPVRLFAISLFLIICGGLLLLGGRLKKMPAVVWHNPLVWLLLAYLVVTIGSMAWAINVKESYFDIAKTIAFLFSHSFWQRSSLIPMTGRAGSQNSLFLPPTFRLQLEFTSFSNM